MALSLQNPDQYDEGWLAEINTTPLVDVMLVLLIIFLLTVPVVSASVNVQLPVEQAQRQDTSGDYLVISIDAAGNLFLNDNFAASPEALAAMLEPVMQSGQASGMLPQLHIRADGSAPYSAVAPIIDMAQGMGLTRVGMLTLPLPAQEGKR
jgi:biopolymer transport protein ExbD